MLALLLVYGAATGVAGLAKDRADHHVRLLILAKQRAAAERVIAQYPMRAAQITRIRAYLKSENVFFPPERVADIRAQIQLQASSAIAFGGGTLMTQMPAAQGAAFSPTKSVRLVVLFRSDIAGLTRVLYRLAQARPVLLVDQISVRDQSAGFGPFPTDAGPRQLLTQITITAYVVQS